MDWYVVWLAACGVPVQWWLGWKLGKFLVKGAWSAACAASVCRWGFAVGSVHGFQGSRFLWMPSLFFSEWWSFLVSPYDSITSTCHGGSWQGIGNWSVYPKHQQRSS